MKQGREEWGSRIGFILAAVGSAIGLGNIWRFPYMAYENGGGAFLIPYFVALFTAGIPFMILEFGVGHRYKGSAPSIFSAIKEKMAWLGWWQVLVSCVIGVYYIAVIGWSICYFFIAFKQGWGTETKDFFYGPSFLGLTGSPFELGGIRWPIMAAVTSAWVICWTVLFGGVKGGIEKANKFFMPLLFVLVLVIMGRAVTLPGALSGVEFMFKPDFNALTDVKVWIAAYGQIFFSLSLGFAIMVTYSSYLPDDSDVTNNACMTAFINCGFSMLAGIMVFAVLGYMASQKGVPIQEVAGAGVGLAFITIPQAINFLPAPGVFGPLFFGALVFAGLSSHISICEVPISSFMEAAKIPRRTAVTLFCMVGWLVSLVFVTGSGLLILDIVDHFINTYGILFAALVEILFLGWFFNLESMREHVNRVSDYLIGSWWVLCLKFFLPAALGYMAVAKLIGDVQKGYGGYDMDALMVFGWGVVIFAVVAACFIGFSVKADSRE